MQELHSKNLPSHSDSVNQDEMPSQNIVQHLGQIVLSRLSWVGLIEPMLTAREILARRKLWTSNNASRKRGV